MHDISDDDWGYWCNDPEALKNSHFCHKKAGGREIWLVESNNFFATTLFSQTVNGKALALDTAL